MTQNKKRKLIAITGGIGSGKSTALKIINSLGYKMLSCDTITAELYKKRFVLSKIKSIFPNAVKGTLFLSVDKKAISAAAFSDENKYKLLTEYFTPLIFAEAMKKAEKLNGLVFIEVPLLFEFGYQNYFDKVIVIKREKQSRIESVKKRSNMTEFEINERIKKQFNYDENNLENYIVIENDGDIEKLKNNIIINLKKIGNN